MHRDREVLLALLLVLVLVGCQALGVRQVVAPDEARARLTTAVGLAAAGQIDDLCSLSPAEASTCRDSVVDFGMLAPATEPEIRCQVAAPDVGPLRHGQIVVVAGVDAAGVDYVTEFVVYDNGEEVAVLDAVFWSGLSIASYDEDTVTWRFDSGSRTCERGGLAVSAAGS